MSWTGKVESNVAALKRTREGEVGVNLTAIEGKGVYRPFSTH